MQSFSKSDIRYGQGAIFRQTYTRNGRTFVTKDWAMKVAHEGRRETFPLGTPNRAAAAARARDIYLSLVAVGWESTLARFKKPKAATSAANNEQQCTVGELLDAVAEAATNQSTVEGYAKKFRQIVSEIFGLSDGDRKHDYQKGGLQEWLTKVHSVHLSDVSPSRVQQWKRSFLAKAGSDPLCDA